MFSDRGSFTSFTLRAPGRPALEWVEGYKCDQREEHIVPPAGHEVVFGGDLLSHTLTSAVPSALAGLASGFGMGPGVSLPLWPP